MAKKIRFKRTTVRCAPEHITMVVTEDNFHYYYYDKNNIYARIEKSMEGFSYNITSVYEGVM